MACIPEEDLLELASGERSLADAPAIEAHVADCPACSGLLSALIAPAREPTRDLAGTMLGPYRLEGLVGAGAMGEVYRARDTRLQRDVAVKVLARVEHTHRLEAEARAAAAIAHPNVVTVYDTGTEDGVPYIVSELITGETLRSLIDRGTIDRRRAIALGRQLARGVAAAHAQGVVHRDLKPGNLIVTGDGTLKILDFGLAKLASDRDVEATEPGTLLGTTGYLAPEQARGEPADARSDIFAIGAILYELLSGRRAFGGATFAERLSGVLRDTPPALDDPAWPIVMRCLEKDPTRRFQSAGDLAWMLEDDAPVRPAAKPRAMISRRAFLAGAAATGAAGVLVGRGLRATPTAPFVPDYRQLTFRQGRVDRARFTPDGDSVIYAALWEDAPSTIYTTRLAGGGTRALELPPAQILAVSSRGQLAISLGHHFVEGFYQHGQLALAPLEGGTPRSLGLDVQDADFTPDGALAIIRRASGRFRLELPAGRVLLEAGWLSNVRVSPDGTQVACCIHATHEDNTGDVIVIPRNGGAARTISADWSTIDGLAWAADGGSQWISASREGGNNSVRSIALDGRELRQLPSIGRVRVHDLARSGTLAVTHINGRLRCMGKRAGGDELELGLSDVTLVAAMAADGSAVACAEFGDVDTARGVYLRTTDARSANRLGGGLAFDLARDGRGVLGTRGGPALTIYPIDQGTPRAFPLPGLVAPRTARWCAGGVVVAASAPGRPHRLWRVTTTVTPLTDEGVDGAFAVSPDGTQVALVVDDRMRIIDASGASRLLDASFAGETLCGWASDHELYVRTLPAPIRVRKLDIATGASTPVLDVTPPRLGLRGVNAFVISDAGDAYAYSYGQELSRLYSMTT